MQRRLRIATRVRKSGVRGAPSGACGHRELQHHPSPGRGGPIFGSPGRRVEGTRVMKRRTASKAPRSRPDVAQRHVAFAAASALLRYPDEALLEDLPLITTATGQLPRSVQRGLGQVCEHLSGNPLLDSQAHYVATFDLKRRCCLHLSYYLNGDTRRRGTAL